MAKKEKKRKGKKGKKGKKNAEPVEPSRDAGWEKAIATGRWERSVSVLPDPALWPTWQALREQVLGACTEIHVHWDDKLGDAFVAELVRLASPKLTRLSLRGSSLLTRVVLSPPFPALTDLDLSACANLSYVLVQSPTLVSVNLSLCPNLTTALIQARGMTTLHLEKCPELKTLMVWSDQLTQVALGDSPRLQDLKLYCPQLEGRAPTPPQKASAPKPSTGLSGGF
ncbi:hypothetical protein KFL_001970100 [Klebsormidium nitens]|uniref:F-box/LRR-repeat protein 15/At3g58940/PEG3-like LRR domain-containing protein n=1 Tax=Klebsormidium nitens TaxID=105231 RepID=A0A1Y1I5B6_KLENI|nr:hypothetical protein KFL_001970100 [Klebsormidium nitens]|eukprot:GAQ84609.1 hypothetical protein KFL_001970100 [Klebsormidium nitens]